MWQFGPYDIIEQNLVHNKGHRICGNWFIIRDTKYVAIWSIIMDTKYVAIWFIIMDTKYVAIWSIIRTQNMWKFGA